MKKTPDPVRIGVLGCGMICQAAHFESCQKARNARLYAICDAADDLRNRMAQIWEPGTMILRRALLGKAFSILSITFNA